MVRLIADRAAVDAELRKGAERAATLAAPLLRDVQQAMGLRIG
jgi:tryptophanyl-tRNA synthetase